MRVPDHEVDAARTRKNGVFRYGALCAQDLVGSDDVGDASTRRDRGMPTTIGGKEQRQHRQHARRRADDAGA